MITTVQPAQHGISGDTKARGRARSRRLELYARSIFGRTEDKIRPELLPPAPADCAWGVRLMETRSRNEDDKLSTEPGQLHKAMLVAITRTFDVEAIDRLLVLDMCKTDSLIVSGDGLLKFSRLIAAGLADMEQKAHNRDQLVTYAVNISDKGRLLIED
jgi:hypothetical protein